MTAATLPAPLVVQAARSLRGTPRLPGDKSISHRALLLAALADGRSTIAGASAAEDVQSTARVIEKLGARVVRRLDAADRLTFEVESTGSSALRPASSGEPLECANSGTTLRLTAGVLAALPFEASLDGDDSLRRRPMARIVEPLRAMGAAIEASSGGTPPLVIRGRSPLRAIEWRPEVASAQVKSAIVLAALGADGLTRVHEPIATRDHTERMLRARGVPVRTTDDGHGGTMVEIEGPRAVATHDEEIPGDASAAAFWLVAGVAHPDAEIRLGGVGINPGRRVAIDILREMNAAIDEHPGATTVDGGEPVADLTARSSDLRAVDVDPRRCAAAIDEIPVLCLAASQAMGTSVFRGVGELRVKESDRLASIVEGLRAFDAKVDVDGDDVRVTGPTRLRGATVDAHVDHRMAMTFAIAGLMADGPTSIVGAEAVAISDPGFITELERIRP